MKLSGSLLLVFWIILSLNNLLELRLVHELWIEHFQPRQRTEKPALWLAHGQGLDISRFSLVNHFLFRGWLSFVDHFLLRGLGLLLLIEVSARSILLRLMEFRSFFSLGLRLCFRLSNFCGLLLALVLNRAELFIEMKLSGILRKRGTGVLVGERSEPFKRLLLELLNSLIIVFVEPCKLSWEIEHVLRVDLGTSIHLAMAINAVTMQELIIEQNDQSWLSLSDDTASSSERNELSEGRVQIHDSISNSEVIDSGFFSLVAKPIRELLLIDGWQLDGLNWLDLKVYGSVALLDVLAVISELRDQVGVKRVKAHLDVRQLTERELLDPS